MNCPYHEAGLCHSCTHIEESYAQQISTKEKVVRALLPEVQWLPTYRSAETGFRNKAKLVVGGTSAAPTLGIFDPNFRGIDLRNCQLYEPGLTAIFPTLADFIGRARLTPFEVPRGRGELKNILVTISPEGGFLIRFVLRSTESVVRIRKHLDWLHDAIPHTLVVTANILPERKAVPEGEGEIILTKEEILPMPLGEVTLRLSPQSFFQTNTAVARALYLQAQAWTDEWVSKRSSDKAANEAGQKLRIWDLYCGVGGFALHLARPDREVLGVEISQQAVKSARVAAREAAVSARFLAGDAHEAVLHEGEPDLVVVNPPRRGIGELAPWIEASTIQAVIYSSCNPASLARDLAAMPSFRLHQARLFDMFPHTSHVETMCMLSRKG